MTTTIKTRIGGNGLRYIDEPFTWLEAPLWYHKRGLMQTSSGYGGKLNSGRKIRLASGRTYRVYVMCYSNSGTAYILSKQERIIVD